MSIRAVLSGALLAAVLVLSGCSGLPTSGPVNAGLPAHEVPTAPDLAFRPSSPQPGATPEQIVAGFLRAATSPEGNWRIAKEFLTNSFEQQWQPTDGVTIDEPGKRQMISAGESGVDLTLTVVADVDETGSFDVWEPSELTLSYVLEQQNGEWRISSAPEGIVLERDFFSDVYRPYPIMFFDPTWSYLVPDVRWFAHRSPSVNTWIARALVDSGPSEWLAGSVYSAFPEDVVLERESVTVDSGVAQVPLTDAALHAAPEVQSRMQRQLDATMRSAGVAEVDMIAGASVIDVEPAPVRSTALEPWPLVKIDGEVGYLTDDGVEALDGVGPVIAAAEVETLALGRGGSVAAARADDGSVLRVTAEGADAVDTRAGLIAPVVDPDGYVWSVPSYAPAAMTAVGADGVIRSLTGAWPQASTISAIGISRDGTRMAAVVTESGRDWLVVAGILRDAEGVPTGIGQADRLARVEGSGYSLDWLDDQSVGVLFTAPDSSSRLITQTVGGLGVNIHAPGGDARTLAAGTTLSTPRVLNADGVLATRRGATWTQMAQEVTLLGTQLGVG